MRTTLARRPRRGLTLIEVLLAAAIFLMSVVAISRLVDMGTDRERDAKLYAQGARLAQAKLGEVEAGMTGMTSSQGSFDGADSQWSWSMTAEPDDVAPNLYLVTVTASCTYRGRQFETSLTQMIFDPAYLGTAGEAQRPDPNADTTTTTDTSTGGSP